jgi:hypothetical protein
MNVGLRRDKMAGQIREIPSRTVGEWTVRCERAYGNPFADVKVDATFVAPDGRTHTMPAFYDGDDTWRVRFRPDRPGPWTYRIASWPLNDALAREGSFEVTPRTARGILEATPGQAWGFAYESGEPAFLLGDTVYNLFGMAHCGGDVAGYLERRAGQGFNVFRARLPVSPFHPPNGYSTWQNMRTWPWGGSEQSPRFDRFNLDYFRTVDQVVARAEDLGVGFEMIMEAWGFEFPFNSRSVFVPEWEELWLRYLVARYDAYNSVYFWTLQNEYEFYPNGDWRHNPVADRWAMRVGRWVKQLAPHGHVVSVHNGPNLPPFAKRFAADPGAIDAVMFQEWGTRGREDGWLASGIEEEIASSFAGWEGSAVFAEYGYERNPKLPITFPPFEYCDGNHTRRGAWRGAFCAMGVINGFENTWGPVMNLEEDQEGVRYLQNVGKFFTQVVPFEQLEVAHDLVLPGAHGRGHRPLALASEGRDLVAVYYPAGGSAALDVPAAREYAGQWWYDPRSGELSDAAASRIAGDDRLAYQAPPGKDEAGWPLDWVLVLFAS